MEKSVKAGRAFTVAAQRSQPARSWRPWPRGPRAKSPDAGWRSWQPFPKPPFQQRGRQQGRPQTSAYKHRSPKGAKPGL